MTLFELLVYLALTALLLPAFFLGMIDFLALERSLDRQLETSHAAFILSI